MKPPCQAKHEGRKLEFKNAVQVHSNEGVQLYFTLTPSLLHRAFLFRNSSSHQTGISDFVDLPFDHKAYFLSVPRISGLNQYNPVLKFFMNLLLFPNVCECNILKTSFSCVIKKQIYNKTLLNRCITVLKKLFLRLDITLLIPVKNFYRMNI